VGTPARGPGAFRPAEALERYEAIRVRLAEELGTDPGPELQRVHADLLAGRPPGLPGGTPPATARVVPRQLPPDTDAFTGRDAALRTLDRLLGDGSTPGPVVVAAIAGTAGIGKTALAVHWAHRVADRFPDGQLYVNLRGFDPSGSPMAPAEAVRGFLDGLQVPPQGIRPVWRHRRACTAACWPAGACWCCWTTPATPARSPRCSLARPAAWCW
jgi:hypothetical protein